MICGLALLCRSSQLPVLRSVHRIVNSFLLRSQVNGNLQRRIGLSIDQLVVASQAVLVLQLQLCMFVLPSGTVLHILLSLLGVNIMCGWALPNLYFSASMLLLWGCTGYRGTGKIHTMIPVVLQDEVVCHVAGHACAILLYVSWTHRLRGASRAINSLTPLLLLPPRFFVAQDIRVKHLYGLSNALSMEKWIRSVLKRKICRIHTADSQHL